MPKEKHSRLDKVLDTVEKLGNKVPHPAIIFLILIVIVGVLSHIFYLMGQYVTFDAINAETGALELTTTHVKSLLSGEGIRFMLTSIVSNLMSFQALGVTLVAMAGVGFAEEVGLIGAMIRKLVKVVPKSSLTAVLVLLGVMSSIASDAGYLVLIPLGAAVFYKVGRHPLAGLSAAFAGVSGGFGVNLVITPVDGMLTEILNDAVHIINPSYSVDLMANFYFSIASTILVVIVSTIINEKLIEPRLGTFQEKGMIANDEITDETKGLHWAFWGFTVVLAFILLITIPSGAPLRHPETDELIGSTPFMDSLIALIISQFISYFNFTNLGTVWAVNSATIIEDMNLSSLALLLSFLALALILDFILVGAIPKFAILTPIFVPLLYQLGVAPEAVLAAYRVADSPVNIITPLMPYFALIVTFATKYQKKTGVGTIISIMLPHAVSLTITWIILFILYYVFQLPLGPGIGMHLN